ncbi:hypothetical protein [Sphingomonas fuzhouensis]|uniref:hypothetical protein n=1 Tax=Sphingomonas fuzhouensis TaxID=3106033 RepID=UPI002AFF7923|nr:hypothetical protein [Sphingomonas sp. SGZ-02]
MKIGLNMADAVLARRATVIAYDYCISSCANYIFGGAARRVVFHDAILGFHGGATYIPREDILADFKKAGVANPVEATRNALVDLNRTIYRQNRFLKAAGIDTHFFQWVDAFNHLPEERRKAICGEEADFFVFSSAFLKSYGFSIAVNEGPHSPTELKTALKGIKAPSSIACYVGIEHRTL